MSQIVLDAIAAEIATLTRVVEVPTGDLGYGTDVSCAVDVAADAHTVDPTSFTVIGEAVLRRLTCPRGRLPDDPSYGIDVRAFLNRATPQSELNNLEGMIRNELAKDARIESTDVSVTFPPPNGLRIALTITPIASNLGPFPFVFAIVDGKIAVETMGNG